MRSAERRRFKFIAALVRGNLGVIRDGRAVSTDGGAEAAIELAEARDLASAGVLVVERDVVRPTAEAQGWLKRRLLEADDSFAAQHRSETVSADGTRMNLAESPLSRLATAARGDAAFLARHQVEAGERVRQLAERACLQPRITMNYSAAQVAGSKGMGHAAELGEMAADARRQLAQIHRVLPRDCAGVVLDVCGLLKGLQTVEQERGWPRRSAKLVLRIGLEQLAQHYGIAAEAVGAESRQRRVWLDEGARPERFD